MKESGWIVKGELQMIIKEVELTNEILAELIACSESWEAENSCHGYRKNTEEDIKGNRIFLAMEDGQMVGYLFGYMDKGEKKNSIYDKDEPFFEVEELYVKPELRSKGIGKKLFLCMEDVMKREKVELILLSTATKNYKAILHFYLDELGMEFWNTRLFKRI